MDGATLDFDKWYARIEPALKERASMSKDGKLAIETIQAIISKYYGGDPRTKRHAIERLKENGKIRPVPNNKMTFIFLDGQNIVLESKEQVEAQLRHITGKAVI
jgi:hypothetical protein